MASVISLLYFFYQSGIVANNVYSFYSFTCLMYPYIKKYGNRIPYDDLETVYQNICKIYSTKVDSFITNKFVNNKSFRSHNKPKLEDPLDSDLWVDLYTQKIISEKL